MIEIKTPALPESVADASVATWHVKEGDFVESGQNLADIETDKVAMELPSSKDGQVAKIHVTEGTTVVAGDTLISIDETKAAPKAAPTPDTTQATPAADAAPAAPAAPAAATPPSAAQAATNQKDPAINPSARKLMEQADLSREDVAATGASRITKQMVQGMLAHRGPINREETRAPLSRIRLRIAERLLQAQQGAAILTTFNEVNLKQISELRKAAKDRFIETHGIKLGFMSFFVKASTIALAEFPQVNASIDGTDILLRNYMDISIAVSSPRGLVVPVLKNAQALSLAEIEQGIADFAGKAKNNKLTIEDMTGGTFSITNGGVFGSLLSTPIINPPQAAILGMHKIMDRPMVEDSAIVIRPIMNLALSYDHRIIDGREAVSFLVRVKELLENPALLLMNLS